MTKTTRLSCAMAAVLHLNLTFGIAMAAEHPAGTTEAQHAEPTAVNAPENQSMSREEATHVNSSQSKTPATQEVPAQTQQAPAQTQQEPECN